MKYRGERKRKILSKKKKKNKGNDLPKVIGGTKVKGWAKVKGGAKVGFKITFRRDTDDDELSLTAILSQYLSTKQGSSSKRK